MAKFIVRRIAWMFLVLFVVSIITFGLMHAVPGGPFSADKAVPAAVLANLNRKYHLDDPLIVQYVSYVGDIVVPQIMTGHQQLQLSHDYLINIPLPFGGDDATFRWMNFGPSIKATSRTVND